MNAATLYRSAFGAEPAGQWSAPGRANLIGEHTDYSGGLVLPFAIDARAHVAIGPSPTGTFEVISAQRSGDPVSVPAGELRPLLHGSNSYDDPATGGVARDPGGRKPVPRWAGYVLGVVWALRQRGFDVPQLAIALDSEVPAGAGLSSSAAVECAVALAVSEYLGLNLDRPTIARIAQRAENNFVGVPCGLMDQMASAASTEGHALFFDIGADTIEHIPFDTVVAGFALLVIDTKSHHSLADGEYAKRRASVEEAAALIGVPLLSQAPFAELEEALTRVDTVGATKRLGSVRIDTLRRRVRHVVTENQRVRETVALLRRTRLAETGAAVGALLSASHASLRDDFEVSCAELDLAAATAEQAGALGARMVGGGFGGSVIALVPSDLVGSVTHAVQEAFAAASYQRPVTRAVTPAAGAHRDA